MAAAASKAWFQASPFRKASVKKWATKIIHHDSLGHYYSLPWYRSGDYDRLHYSGHAWCRFLRVLHSTHLENVLLAVLICALSGSSLRIMLVMIMALVSISNNFVLNHSNIDITQEFALQVQLQISSRPFWVSYITVTANSFSLFFMHTLHENVVPALMHV